MNKDTIYRQAAIDTAKRLHDVAWTNCKETKISANTMIDALKNLPSAQPEKVCIAKITLSEEQIREAVEKAKSEIVQALPSAQPERKKGKWRRRIIDSGYNADWICSECGYRVKTDFVNYNYCPNCGADMRGEEHG